LATNFSSSYRTYKRDEIQANPVGNTVRSLKYSVEKWLRKLRTKYINLLYFHWWDFPTSTEEIMASLHELVTAAKATSQAPDVDVQVSKVLEGVAAWHNTSVTSVALVYVMHKVPRVPPVIGGRKIEHLLGNMETLGLVLSRDDLLEIERAYDANLGFPMTYLFQSQDRAAHLGNSTVSNVAARFNYPGQPQPIIPKDLEA
ncbi:Aldo/keto reductase, partial [Aspergillus steynii IBT 23096]